MKKMLSLMITLCMLLLILPLQTAAAEAPEDAAKEAADAAERYDQAVALFNGEKYEAAFPMNEEMTEESTPEAITLLDQASGSGLETEQNEQEPTK